MRYLTALLLVAFLPQAQRAAGPPAFSQASGIGPSAAQGSGEYQGATKSWRITASGANMWAGSDDFYMMDQKVAGDFSLTVNVDWATPGGNPHKKAGPIVRAGLEPDDVYADVAQHGVGLIALQYRKTKGGETLEVRTPITAPATLRLERTGNVISAEVAKPGGAFQPIGALSIDLPETAYVGLAACSHDTGDRQTALFTNVSLREIGIVPASQRAVESTLEVADVQTGERRIVRRAIEHFEAPNWSRDGRELIYNAGGHLYRIPAEGGTPQMIRAGNVVVNNDHGLSPDGSQIAISGEADKGESQIWIVPAAGGEPRRVVEARPSYWHGWSPDGKTLAFCAERNGNFDVYTIPVEGGTERRLTTADGLDDGPDYSPDGQWIYFNSVRTGLMQIWRMHPVGSGQEQVSRGGTADWFAHPSPDGKWIVFLAYDKSVSEHPPNKDVTLKVMAVPDGVPHVFATLFGGQGTINVPSWSPDSKYVAFVSYRLVKRP